MKSSKQSSNKKTVTNYQLYKQRCKKRSYIKDNSVKDLKSKENLSFGKEKKKF